MIATLTADVDLANWNGVAHQYHLDDAFDGWYHIVVERFVDGTSIHPCHPNGGAVPHPGGGLAPWRTFGPITDDEALAELGYEIFS